MGIKMYESGCSDLHTIASGFMPLSKLGVASWLLRLSTNYTQTSADIRFLTIILC